jgi:hypothetical protein
VVSSFDVVIWEGTEEDGGDEISLRYDRDLDIVALRDAGHDAVVFLEPQAIARLSASFLAWARGVSLN